MAGAEADVMQPAVVANGDRSPVVDLVGPDPVVGTDDGPGGDGLRAGRIRLRRGVAAEGAVRPDRVVVGLEAVQLVLRPGDRGGAGLGGEPLLQRLVEPFDLAASLRMVGPGVGDLDAEVSSGLCKHFDGSEHR